MVPSLIRWQSGSNSLNRKKQIQGADDIITCVQDRVFAIDHRERRRALLGEMDDGLRLEILYEFGRELIIGKISRMEFDRKSGGLLSTRGGARAAARIGVSVCAPSS